MGKFNAMFKNMCDQLKVEDPNEVIRLINAGHVKVVMLRNFLDLNTIVKLNPTPLKKTTECFSGVLWRHIPDSFYDSLPEYQEATGSGKSRAFRPEKDMAFSEMAQNLLDTNEENLVNLQWALIEAGHFYTFPQICDLVDRQEAGENVGLIKDHSNIFFIKNKEGGISVVRVRHRIQLFKKWLPDICPFNYGPKWHPEIRVFSRN
ncbi:MAG: hypothetical protein MRY49_01610 [Candidatus Pacebacteria bacterium]|nr:hypothetical protein [Candidatus Paceibacterota bacterium]